LDEGGEAKTKWLVAASKGSANVFAYDPRNFGKEEVGKTAIIVESPLSALSLAERLGHPCIALLGHTPSGQTARLTAKICRFWGVETAGLALDPDVPRTKVIGVANRLSRAGLVVKPVYLTAKPRFCGEEELVEKCT
jgi:hypothetical protein